MTPQISRTVSLVMNFAVSWGELGYYFRKFLKMGRHLGRWGLLSRNTSGRLADAVRRTVQVPGRSRTAAWSDPRVAPPWRDMTAPSVGLSQNYGQGDDE
jgi:hypothetical protein